MRHPSLFKSAYCLMLGRRRRGRRLAMAMVASVLATAGWPGSLQSRALAAEDAGFAEALQLQVGKLLERARPAVARIEATDAHSPISGTGFFIDANGMLLTSYTIGGETRDIVVILGEAKFSARRVACDERAGIAILKVEAKTAFLPLGCSKDLAVGAPVITAGYPMDLPLSPSFGVIGGFDRKYLGRYFATTHLRANVSVQRGEGGAPLLNMKGEVVGILISSVDNGSATFALPVEAAEKVQKDYVRFGEVRPGWLGISLEALPEASASGSTARIRELFPDGPAQKAGVLVDDIIVKISGVKITAPEDMLDPCYFQSAADRIDLTVARGAEYLDFKIELGDVPGHHPPPNSLSSAESPMKMGAEK